MMNSLIMELEKKKNGGRLVNHHMITAEVAAEKWGVSKRRVNQLCSSGEIAGARKEGQSWVIPANAKRPIDKRKKKVNSMPDTNIRRLPLPVGVSEYRLASDRYYYIDKTMLIKEFLDEQPMVSLFTRPRRFGKTLNMDMLRVFFEKSEEDTSVYFQDKAIWGFGDYYRFFQGKYPVVFLSFKDIKYDTWEKTFKMLVTTISDEFSRHTELIDSERCSVSDNTFYQKAVEQALDEVELSRALNVLSRMLYQHYGVQTIIIIDEYDVPIQQGHTKGFYNQVVDFMRNLFSGGLKDNRNLAYGFLTGILRVANESIFSGLNNLVTHSVIDNKYSSYFGFTKQEVEQIAEYYNATDKLDEISDWYDGYRFGETEIFNPWSVINYFNQGCTPRAFWQSTGSNDIISEVIENADEEIYDRLEKLLKGDKFPALIDTGVIYPQIKNNPATIYSFLLVAGYLKAENARISSNGDYVCEVSLPNKEIRTVYNKEILQKFNNIGIQSSAALIQEAIYSNDTQKLQKALHIFLVKSASCFDTTKELFFHGMLLGLCAMFDDAYYVSSNRESGDGRYDLQLEPKKTDRPGIILELKSEKKCSPERLSKLAQTALNQINDQKYDTEMKRRGITTVIKYGVAFSGKNVEICTE